MNKTAVFVIGLVIILSTSCIKHKDIWHIGYHYVTNTTGKRIVHEVICNPKYVDKDTFQFYSGGTTDQMEFEWQISVALPSRDGVIYYWNTYIYCIDDTISLCWGHLWGNDVLPKDGCNQYFCYVNREQDANEKEFTWTKDYYLTITDSIVQAMQKDYTMLHKFSEYYAK